MPSVQFYQVNGTTPGEVDAVLPMLLEKALKTGQRIAVRCPSLERRDRLNAWLWSFSPTQFLPHGIAEDGYAEQQPVFLTADATCPNEAKILLLLGGLTDVAVTEYDKVLDFFDSTPAQVEQARQRWKKWHAQGVELAYFAQTENGWQKRR